MIESHWKNKPLVHKWSSANRKESDELSKWRQKLPASSIQIVGDPEIQHCKIATWTFWGSTYPRKNSSVELWECFCWFSFSSKQNVAKIMVNLHTISLCPLGPVVPDQGFPNVRHHAKQDHVKDTAVVTSAVDIIMQTSRGKNYETWRGDGKRYRMRK